jgi:hypothetical protein
MNGDAAPSAANAGAGTQSASQAITNVHRFINLENCERKRTQNT